MNGNLHVMNSIQSFPNILKWQEHFQRNELRKFALFLRRLAEKVLLTEDFTTKTPQKLARLIIETSKLLETSIQEAPFEFLPSIDDFIERIAAHLRYIERARITQTPWSLVHSAEYFFKQQVGPKSNFIIRPTWSYNYSLIGEFWGFYKTVLKCWSWFPLDELKKKLPFEDNETIYCISFPRIERQNCLLHVNWGHELGHIFAAKWMETNFANMWTIVQPEIQKRIQDHVKKNPPPVDPLFKEVAIHDSVARLTRKTMDTARSGLCELVCDIIGVHLFGPSAIASAFEFASRYFLDVSPLQCHYYPPWRYRFREMLNYCEEDFENHSDISYHGSVIKPFINWLHQVKELTYQKSDIQILESNIITKEAYDFISSKSDIIINQVISLLPSCSQKQYKLHERSEFIEKLVERLRHGIPPNETVNLSKNPASLQDIISAGWIFQIERSSKDIKWGKIEDIDVLFRLVLKACESSHIQRIWGPELNKKEE